MTTKNSVMLAALYNNPYSGSQGSVSSFTLPDIPEEKRIHVTVCKIRKHATKRRGNKLHDKRRTVNK